MVVFSVINTVLLVYLSKDHSEEKHVTREDTGGHSGFEFDLLVRKL